jgi:hypothetical protein
LPPTAQGDQSVSRCTTPRPAEPCHHGLATVAVSIQTVRASHGRLFKRRESTFYLVRHRPSRHPLPRGRRAKPGRSRGQHAQDGLLHPSIPAPNLTTPIGKVFHFFLSQSLLPTAHRARVRKRWLARQEKHGQRCARPRGRSRQIARSFADPRTRLVVRRVSPLA